jgi:hypothetical protein
MVMSPVPYTDVPARPWLSADAGRWVDTRVPRWVRPVGPAVLLLVAVIMAGLVLAPDPVCTSAAPCGADWLDAAATICFLPHLVWLFLLPELAVVSAPLLLLWLAEPAQWQGSPAQQLANAAVVAALCWGWAAVVVRLRTRRRQRALVLDAAGGLTAYAPVPDDVRPWRRGLLRGVCGALVCLVAGALVISVDLDSRAGDRPVPSPGPGTVVATPRTEHAGDGVTFVAEPTDDTSGRQALALLLAGVGVTLLGSGLLSHRRAAALRRAGVPVLRVLAARFGGRTEIFSVDDRNGLRPALSYVPHLAARTRTPLRHALLYGAPREGGELILVSATEAGHWMVEATTSPIRQGPPGGIDHPLAARRGAPRTATLRRDTEHRQAAEARVRQALTSMSPATAPVSWHPGLAGRSTGVLFLFMGVDLTDVLETGSHAWWSTILRCIACLWWADIARRLITWRITADATGLHIRLWRTRRIPWADVTRARYTHEGKLIVRCRARVDDVEIGSVGFPWLERRLGRPGRAERAADEITAMVREPRLRPAGLA